MIEGAAVFRHASGPAALSYAVYCDANWATKRGEVRGHVGTRSVAHEISRIGSTWYLDGIVIEGLDHLDDLDFGFTPATNFLQTRRLPLTRGRAMPLHAAWFDLDTGEVGELRQIYLPSGAGRVWYEAPDLGFAAMLEIGENGFVEHYPSLWRAERDPAG